MRLTESQQDKLRKELGDFTIESAFQDTSLNAEFTTIKGETVFEFHIEYAYGRKWCEAYLDIHFTEDEEEDMKNGIVHAEKLHERFQKALDDYWEECVEERVQGDQKEKLWEEGSSQEFRTSGE